MVLDMMPHLSLIAWTRSPIFQVRNTMRDAACGRARLGPPDQTERGSLAHGSHVEKEE